MAKKMKSDAYAAGLTLEMKESFEISRIMFLCKGHPFSQ